MKVLLDAQISLVKNPLPTVIETRLAQQDLLNVKMVLAKKSAQTRPKNHKPEEESQKKKLNMNLNNSKLFVQVEREPTLISIVVTLILVLQVLVNAQMEHVLLIVLSAKLVSAQMEKRSVGTVHVPLMLMNVHQNLTVLLNYH